MWQVSLEPGRLSYDLRGKKFVKGQTYLVASPEEARVFLSNGAFVVREIVIEREKAVAPVKAPAPAVVKSPTPPAPTVQHEQEDSQVKAPASVATKPAKKKK